MAFRLRLVSGQTNIPFVRYQMLAFAVSSLLAVASIVLFISVGVNKGIDFEGGTRRPAP